MPHVGGELLQAILITGTDYLSHFHNIFACVRTAFSLQTVIIAYE